LGYIHAKNYAHRDIKPDNIMITNDNVIKYIDLGLSCLYKARDDYVTDTCHGHPGSLTFMPPEFFYQPQQSNQSTQAYDYQNTATRSTIPDISILPDVSSLKFTNMSEDFSSDSGITKPAREDNIIGAKAHDVWSLAVTMFQLANGDKAFPFKIYDNQKKTLSKNEIMQNIANAPQFSSNYIYDDGRTDRYLSFLLINNWKERPTINQAIKYFVDFVDV
jgi:serine/threonine protein kinase